MTFLILFAGTSLVLCPTVLACPMCKEYLQRGVDAALAWRFGWGIYYSIILLLAVPMSLTGLFIYFIARSYRKSSELKAPSAGTK